MFVNTPRSVVDTVGACNVGETCPGSVDTCDTIIAVAASGDSITVRASSAPAAASLASAETILTIGTTVSARAAADNGAILSLDYARQQELEQLIRDVLFDAGIDN